MKKDLLQKSSKQPYSTPVVTAVSFSIEHGFAASQLGFSTQTFNSGSWDSGSAGNSGSSSWTSGSAGTSSFGGPSWHNNNN